MKRKQHRRNKRYGLVAVILVVILGVGLIYSLTQRTQATKQTATVSQSSSKAHHQSKSSQASSHSQSSTSQKKNCICNQQFHDKTYWT